MPNDELHQLSLPRSERASDNWTWRARYADGSCIDEYGADGDHGFADIELSKVVAFELLPIETGRPAFVLLIDQTKGQRPIFFRTRATEWLIAGGEPETLQTCIGRQETVGGQNVSTYIYFDDQCRIVISDRRL